MIGVGYLIESLGGGGAQRQLNELVRALDRSRFRPRVLTWADDGRQDRDDLADGTLRFRPRRWKGDLGPVREAAAWLRRGEVDVLHGMLDTGNIYAVAARTMARRGVAVASQRTGGMQATGIRAAVKRWTHRSAAVTVSNSAAGAQLIERLGGGRVVVIRNGIDTERFAPPSPGERVELRRRLGLPVGGVVVLTVGTLRSEKGYLDLLAAISADAFDATFAWVGSAQVREAQEIRSAIASSPARAQVVIGATTDRIEDWFRAADLLIHPSRREGTPNAVLEAMSCGIPVIAADVGDVAEVVGDTGWLVEPGAPASIGSALHEAMSLDRDTLRARGAAARLRAQAVAPMSRMVAEHEALYERLAASVRASHGTRS